MFWEFALGITVEMVKMMFDVWIYEYRKGRWTGKTLKDQLLLRQCGTHIYFSDKEYDSVLTAVSDCGGWLCVSSYRVGDE